MTWSETIMTKVKHMDFSKAIRDLKHNPKDCGVDEAVLPNELKGSG